MLTWLTIYRHTISVVTVMLGTLQHTFLPDALDFYGVHRDRMIQVGKPPAQCNPPHTWIIPWPTSNPPSVSHSQFQPSLPHLKPPQLLFETLITSREFCYSCFREGPHWTLHLELSLELGFAIYVVSVFVSLMSLSSFSTGRSFLALSKISSKSSIQSKSKVWFSISY